MTEMNHHGDLDARLREAGLRPTRQRRELADLLYGTGDRHVTAEVLHREAGQAGVRVSLATVYNTLHQFTEAGLLREVVVDAHRSYFDTNTGHHHHFYNTADQELTDIPGDHVAVTSLPAAPEGMEIREIDVVVRISPKDG
jgi:Fur family iron response transcriptional regulator